MRLIRVSAKNFRTLENFELEFKSNYSALSGHNNAGKSSVIRILAIIIGDADFRPWVMSDLLIYAEDRTKWVRDDPSIELGCTVMLSPYTDSAVVSYMERLLAKEFSDDEVKLDVLVTIDRHDDRAHKVEIDGDPIDNLKAKDILQKLRSLRPYIIHNSPQGEREIYFRSGGRPFYAYDLDLTTEQHRSVIDAESKLLKEFRKAAKVHTTELNEILSRVSGKIGVEFSTESTSRRRMPLVVNLTDRNVETSMLDWGSGTQNRTKILMSLMQAAKANRVESPENRINPLIIVEEPESFLHPSAQSEFGQVLQMLSNELQVQMIVSTHSPYMLNQSNTTVAFMN